MSSIESLIKTKFLCSDKNIQLPAIFVSYDKYGKIFTNTPVFVYINKNSRFNRVPRNAKTQIQSFFDMNQWQSRRYSSLNTVCTVHTFHNDDRTYQTHQVKEYRDWKRNIRHALDDSMGHIYGIMEVKKLKTPQNDYISYEFHIRVRLPDRLLLQ